ncbi:hypothetical protein LINPERHAP1_LOCUS21718 [Linum perenne]
MAELRGAISGLELVWEFGYHLVELQLDSKVAINILTASEDPHHQHIYREANKVADFLADEGYLFPLGIHLFPLSNCMTPWVFLNLDWF